MLLSSASLQALHALCPCKSKEFMGGPVGMQARSKGQAEPRDWRIARPAAKASLHHCAYSVSYAGQPV